MSSQEQHPHLWSRNVGPEPPVTPKRGPHTHVVGRKGGCKVQEWNSWKAVRQNSYITEGKVRLPIQLSLWSQHSVLSSLRTPWSLRP